MHNLLLTVAVKLVQTKTLQKGDLSFTEYCFWSKLHYKACNTVKS